MVQRRWSDPSQETVVQERGEYVGVWVCVCVWKGEAFQSLSGLEGVRSPERIGPLSCALLYRFVMVINVYFTHARRFGILRRCG